MLKSISWCSGPRKSSSVSVVTMSLSGMSRSLSSSLARDDWVGLSSVLWSPVGALGGVWGPFGILEVGLAAGWVNWGFFDGL